MQQRLTCPVCGFANPPGQKFCVTCGAALSNVCPNCGASINPGDKFCGNCGAQLPTAAPPQQPYVPPPQQQYVPPQQYAGGQSGYGQTNYAGAPQQQYAPQQPYEQAPAAHGAGWEAARPRQSSKPLIILLVVLIIALGGFAWWAFMGNPPWAGSSCLQVTNGPFIQALSDNTTTTRDVTITWETNIPAIGKVDYGADANYGNTTAWETSYTQTHSIKIPALKADTPYHYSVTVKDKSNNEVETADSTFKTPQ